MGDAAGQAAYSLHFLGLAKLFLKRTHPLFRLLLLCNVRDNASLQHRSASAIVQSAAMSVNPTDRTVGPSNPKLDRQIAFVHLKMLRNHARKQFAILRMYYPGQRFIANECAGRQAENRSGMLVPKYFLTDQVAAPDAQLCRIYRRL